MKCVAAIEVDLERSPIGTKSRLTEDLLGEPILSRTLKRISLSEKCEQVFVICPESQVAVCQSLVPNELKNRVTVRAAKIKADPYRNLVRTSRKWSLDSWRGGLGGTCSIDEYARSDELAVLAYEENADCVMSAPSSAPLIDPKMIDALIDHADVTSEEARMTFAQAPPGLVGTVFRRELLIEMGQKHVPPGFVMAYKPDVPMMDLTHKSCCFTAPEAVRYAAGRLIADTDRSFGTVQKFLQTGQPIEAERVAKWLLNREQAQIPDLPREVEIELTTEDQLPDSLLRPRGSRVPKRGPMTLATVEKIVTELAAHDDALIVLGGFGEPLLHPQFGEILRILKKAGIYGIAVRTNGLALNQTMAEVLIEHEVDVINVMLDAWSSELYAKVQGAARLNEVKQNLADLATLKRERETVAPLIVPELTKSIETMGEMEAFFDGWLREEGWANIRGYSHYAGQLPDRAVMSMAPPTRCPCRQIRHRATVLANDRLAVCDQDFTGKHTVGSLSDASLAEQWQGTFFKNIRSGHDSGKFNVMPLCVTCDEWHRP